MAPPSHNLPAHLPTLIGREEAVTTVRERLRVYGRDTKPLLDYYRARPTFRSIDGAQGADRVAFALAAAVDALDATTGSNGAGEGAGR